MVAFSSTPGRVHSSASRLSGLHRRGGRGLAPLAEGARGRGIPCNREIGCPGAHVRRGQGMGQFDRRGGMSRAAGAGEGVEPGGLSGQDCTPLLSALVDTADKVRVPFFFPGHQMGRGSPLEFMKEALLLDLPEDVEDIDCLSYADGPIRESQQLAARLFGARHSFFLCNGSTGGILAALMAAVQRHQRESAHLVAPVIILPRNAHKSAVQGLILCGAQAVWLPPLYDAHFEVAFAFRLQDLEEALREHGDRVAAVLCVSPTYHGVVQNISAVKNAIARSARTEVPLIVDEAHGSHLSLISGLQRSGVGGVGRWWLPSGGLARGMGALEGGAEVVVQSTHKTLTSLTQSSMLHLASDLLYDEMAEALDMIQSSSPSALLLASLDATRHQFGSELGGGRVHLRRALRLSQFVRLSLKRYTPKLRVLQGPADLTPVGRGGGGGVGGIDPLRLVVYTGAVCSGDDAATFMEDNYGVFCELQTDVVCLGCVRVCVCVCVCVCSCTHTHRYNTQNRSDTIPRIGLFCRITGLF